MNIERLPFDQYQRYRLVADLVERLGEKSDEPLRVLDVGGRTALLREFLPDVRVELVDMEASEASGLVLGDGSALPFATESFDVVCAFDTLEHVPPERREAFVEETWRVTRKWVLLAGPYDAPRVRRAERILARFIKDKLGFEHRYLAEHLSNGLPVRKDIEAQLASLGGAVLSVGHANLDRWLALMSLELYLDDDPALRSMAGSIFEFYNRSLYASDHADPVYRHVVIGAFGGASLPDLVGLLDPPVAPKKTLEPFAELSRALMAFDAERALWKLERKAFRSSVEVLERDLAGHQELTLKLREELENRKRVAADLREDLKGHRAALRDERKARKAAEKAARAASSEVESLRAQVAELGADLKGHQAALEQSRMHLDGWESSVEELVRDLEGHRGALAAAHQERASLEQHTALVARDLEGHRAALAELRGTVDSWEHELAGLAEALGACQRERDAALEVAATLELDLAGHRAALEEARGIRQALEQQARELESDLEGHRGSLRELKQERDVALQVVETLGKDLDGHRAALADRDRLLEQLRAEQALAKESEVTEESVLDAPEDGDQEHREPDEQ